jgi:hypothetical protein
MPTPTEMQTDKEPPTIRILVVADIDLESASALAESALATYSKQTKSNPLLSEDDGVDTSHFFNPLHEVDLCVACGPFTREDDLRNYYQGRQRRRHIIRQFYTHPSVAAVANTNQGDTTTAHSGYGQVESTSSWLGYTAPTQVLLDNTNMSSPSGVASASAGLVDDCYPTILPPPSQPIFHDQTKHNNNSKQPHYFNAEQSLPRSTVRGINIDPTSYPYQRSKEETAALEGLVTAAISQLESIVCRVVVVPGGKTDPITISLGQGGDDDDVVDSELTSNDASTSERRLTPNSRNIHQRWMPLAPGIGIAGLAYLEWQKLKEEAPNTEGNRSDDSDMDEVDDSAVAVALNVMEPQQSAQNRANIVSPDQRSRVEVSPNTLLNGMDRDKEKTLEHLRHTYG